MTGGISLAVRCLEQGALVLKPDGKAFAEHGIGMVLANRELMQGLRETGQITDGRKPFQSPTARNFLTNLKSPFRQRNAWACDLSGNFFAGGGYHFHRLGFGDAGFPA